MEEVISKEEFNELMKLEGKVKGMAPRNVAEFLLREKKEEGLKKLEDTMRKLGYPIKYKEIKIMNFYPLGLLATTYLVIRKLFNFDDKKFQEIGSFQAKYSFFLRIFGRHFFSYKKIAKKVPRMWRTYYTIGDLTAEFDEKERYAILRLDNFRCHPLHCQANIGYFSAVLQMVVGSKVTCKETRCVFRGDEHHEFLLKW